MANEFYSGMPGPAAIAQLQALWDRVSSVGPLVDGATITVDISRPVRCFDVTLFGNRALAFTGGSAALDGKMVVVRVRQDSTGGRTLTANASVAFSSDVPALSISTVANKKTLLVFQYDHATGKYDFLSFNRGF